MKNKIFLSLMLSLFIVLILCACGGNGNADTLTDTSTQDTTTDSTTDTSTDTDTEEPQCKHKNVVVDYAVSATCTREGLTPGSHCEDCGEVLEAQEVIPKSDHLTVSYDYVAPTCGQPGQVGGVYCGVCLTDIVKPTVIPALEHGELIYTQGQAATCSKTGLTDGKYCSICGTFVVKQMVIDKLSHNEVVTPRVEATCQSEGSTEKRQCTVCGEVTLKSQKIEKTGHTVIVDKAVAANCSETGLTEGSHCSVCNEVIEAQKTVNKNSNHVYGEFATVTSSPSLSSSGSGKVTCVKCGKTENITFSKLTSNKLSKDDIYSIETDQYNPAYDNRWKVVDGSTNVSSIYSAGDWFGNVGDVLVITLNQEMVLTDLKVYTAGNYTYATVRVKDSKGNTTLQKSIKADGAANGGTPQTHTLASGSSIKAYTIEIEITSLKWNDAKTLKVSEVEIKAAKQDTRIEHTHAYRELVETTREATCQLAGLEVYECFCGKQTTIETKKGDHVYDILSAVKQVSCTVSGYTTYKCACGKSTTTNIEPQGHIYYKLLEYTVEPTSSTYGKASFKCNNCSFIDEKSVAPLPIEEINYLRVEKIENGKVILTFNIYGDRPNYEIRYSLEEITSANFLDASTINATIDGTRKITVEISLDAGLEKAYYVALRPYSGDNYGKIVTIRVGGDGEIPIDYNNANIYHGEVLNSFRPLFDDDTSTKLGVVFPNSGDTKELYGSKLSPIIDLEYLHYVTKVKLYFDTADKTVTVRWSDTPIDFQSVNAVWDGYKTFKTTSGWNEIQVNKSTRYIQIIFTDGDSPCEVEAYGYQCGNGDEISTEKRELPTMGNLLGMCGFVAAGGGHTPIDEVSCVGVLREYHNFGWSYQADKYGAKSNVFTSTWMGDFDYEYRVYKQAGLNVIPCIQWKLGSGETISYKVDSENRPVYSGGKLVAASFWERFNPYTYFVYADNIFAFAARYGSNNSTDLLAIAKLHCSDTPSVGQNSIEWIEMGNEPEGSWNGIHNYLSAYQLAAATSATYDGHCRTLVVTSTGGYHLGGKNADPNIKLAMAGVSGVSNEYIMAMCYWMKANRNDGKTAFDAFNVHHYMTKSIELPNGSTTYVGISPEEANIAGLLSQLIGIRDKYYPEKEVWITEFGWDTNQSYATSTSAHAYGEYTGRQVQAMWLTRTYLILSAIGVDKADMYMCHDAGVEEISVGKYGTSGVIAYEYDANGKEVKVKKDSYYYLYTLKNTLGDYTFECQIEAYNDNVNIYKYKTAEGKTAYAVWCGTSDGTKVNGYQLGVSADSATLIETQYGDIDGVSTNLIADEYGYVSIDISENPIYILVD